MKLYDFIGLPVSTEMLEEAKQHFNAEQNKKYGINQDEVFYNPTFIDICSKKYSLNMLEVRLRALTKLGLNERTKIKS